MIFHLSIRRVTDNNLVEIESFFLPYVGWFNPNIEKFHSGKILNAALAERIINAACKSDNRQIKSCRQRRLLYHFLILSSQFLHSTTHA
jgi:hypothetical protein